MTPDPILVAEVLCEANHDARQVHGYQVAALLSHAPDTWPKRVVIEQSGPDEDAVLHGLEQPWPATSPGFFRTVALEET